MAQTDDRFRTASAGETAEQCKQRCADEVCHDGLTVELSGAHAAV